MSIVQTQRWRDRRDSYRPAGEPIAPTEYEVAELSGDIDAKRFVQRHHYSGTYPAARFRFGLWRGPTLVGVAVFSHPVQNKVLTNVFGGTALESVELGRFILLDDVPANGETWFLARCRRVLKRKGLRGIVSFSDPIARETAEGTRVFPGHIGTIYQASNAAYLGRATGRTLRLLPNGRVFSERAVSKIRQQERGYRYAVAQLVEAGAPYTQDADHTWLQMALDAVTRKLRHAGNLRYAWVLNGPTLASQVYPKFRGQIA
jgi:hypothetical protein